MDKVHKKLARKMGCEDPDAIPSSLVLKVLSLIKAGSPTMAQIRYTEDKMVPLMRSDYRSENWNAKEVILRCRWDDSPVLVEYKEFLRNCAEIKSRTHPTQPLSASGRGCWKRTRSAVDDLRDSRPTQQPRYGNGADENQPPGRPQIDDIRRQPLLAPHRFLPYENPHHFNPGNNSGPGLKMPPPHLPSPPTLQWSPSHSNSSRGRFQTPPPPIHAQSFDRYDHFKANRFKHPGDPSHLRPPHTPLGPQEENRQIVPRNVLGEDKNHRRGGIRVDGAGSKDTKRLEFYLNDGDASDNDESAGEDGEDEFELSAADERAMRMNESFQQLYSTVLPWPIFELKRERPFLPNGNIRPLNTREKLNTYLLTGMKPWLQTYIDRDSSIVPDVTKVKTVSEYSNHWKALLPLEIRAAIQDGIGQMLPQCKAGIKKCFQDELEQHSFIGAVVKRHSASKKLVNLTCLSFSPMINKRIAEELQGGTICVGYISSKTASTDLILMGCRRASWEPEDVTFVGNQRTIERIELNIVVSRDRIREVGVFPENILHLRHLCHFAPYLRMQKAIEEVAQLPSTLRDTLYGDNCPAQAASSGAVNESIDPGCAKYLERLEKSSAKVDVSQIEALRSTLGTIGDCKLGSSSASLVHGPPGTGKTTTIIHLIGALLHHSLVGHVGREQINLLKSHIPIDKIERCRVTPGGIRILVCASSNKGVDNILERLHRKGIPDGKGGTIWPQTARISRARYDQGDLHMYSVDQKALPFDQYIHNFGAGRTIASNKSRNTFFRECIIVLTTLISSGGARFRSIKVPFDVVIVDEIGQACETETLVPLTSAQDAATSLQ